MSVEAPTYAKGESPRALAFTLLVTMISGLG